MGVKKLKKKTSINQENRIYTTKACRNTSLVALSSLGSEQPTCLLVHQDFLDTLPSLFTFSVFPQDSAVDTQFPNHTPTHQSATPYNSVLEGRRHNQFHEN